MDTRERDNHPLANTHELSAPEGRAHLRHSPDLFHTTFPAMGTIFEIIGRRSADGCAEREELVDAFVTLALDREDRWSKFLPTSEVSSLNAEAGSQAGLSVSAETGDLLARALYFAHMTRGVASPTIGALTTLWDVRGWLRDLADGCQRPIPTHAEIEKTRKQCGVEALSWEADGRFHLADGASLDLGYIAKGYVADELRDMGTDFGLSSVLVSVGTSSVSVAGHRATGAPWRVGIRSLTDDPRGIVGSIELAPGQSLATSGDYVQRLPNLLDGLMIHHLIDPRTGYPADSGVRQATVVAPNGTVAEVASLVLAITGELDAHLWPQVEWLAIRDDGVRTSAGLNWHHSN